MPNYEEEDTVSYADFMALVKGDLLRLYTEEGYEGYHRVLFTMDLEGVRYILAADSEALAAQDGAEHIEVDSTILTYDSEEACLSEINDPVLFAQVAGAFHELAPDLVPPVDELMGKPLFEPEADAVLALSDYQAMQADWDERYVEPDETIPLVRSVMDLQIRAAAFGGLAADLETIQDHPHEKEMRDELAGILAAMQSDMFRLANNLEVNLQEVYHHHMAATEQQLLAAEALEAGVEAE